MSPMKLAPILFLAASLDSGRLGAQDLAEVVANVTGVRPAQVLAAQWLIAELDKKDAVTLPLRSSLFHVTGDGPQDTIGVFYFARANGEAEFKALAEMARLISGAREKQTYLPRQAIVLRGTQAQMSEAEWLLTQLDRDLPLAEGRSTPPYTASKGDILTVFYLSASMPEPLFRERITAIRVAGNIATAYAYEPTRVFAVRAKPEQLARVAALLGP
jgi:hypothetical protein